jgi:hypothetical protein
MGHDFALEIQHHSLTLELIQGNGVMHGLQQVFHTIGHSVPDIESQI